MDQFFKIQDLGAIAPELELALFGMMLLVFDLLVKSKRWLAGIALAGIAWAGYFLVFRLNNVEVLAYNGLLVVDQYAWFFKLLFLAAAALSIIISLRYLDIE